jgi:hypothetical protein
MPDQNEPTVPAQRSLPSYPWCRRFQILLVVLGKLSLGIAVVLLVYLVYAIVMLGANGNGLERTIWAVAIYFFAGILQLVQAELLGGVVSFLLKNECASEINSSKLDSGHN